MEPQPGYPFLFVQADALGWLERWCVERVPAFVAIHASPPCQFATDYRRAGNVRESANLVERTRELLLESGLPYVIENVVGARKELIEPVLLCGSMFEDVEGGTRDLQRHRLFEANWALLPPDVPCRHKIWAPDRYPGGRSVQRTGHSTGLVRSTVEISAWDIPLETKSWAMGIDWMNREELAQAIPPAYTVFIGHQLLGVEFPPR